MDVDMNGFIDEDEFVEFMFCARVTAAEGPGRRLEESVQAAAAARLEKDFHQGSYLLHYYCPVCCPRSTVCPSTNTRGLPQRPSNNRAARRVSSWDDQVQLIMQLAMPSAHQYRQYCIYIVQ